MWSAPTLRAGRLRIRTSRPIDSDPQVVDCAIIEMKVPVTNRFQLTQLRSWRGCWRLERPHQQIRHGFLTDELRFPRYIFRIYSRHENLRCLRPVAAACEESHAWRTLDERGAASCFGASSAGPERIVFLLNLDNQVLSALELCPFIGELVPHRKETHGRDFGDKTTGV